MEKKMCNSCGYDNPTEGGEVRKTGDGRSRFICGACIKQIKSVGGKRKPGRKAKPREEYSIGADFEDRQYAEQYVRSL